MQEIIAFELAADWIIKLAKKYNQIRAEHREELERIGEIFSPPDEISKYYIEPECQHLNPADKDEDKPATDIRQPVFKIISTFLSSEMVVRDGGSSMFILADAGMGKTSLLMMLKLAHLGKFWPTGYNFVLLKLGEDTLETIETIKGKYNTILLLDSLDEDPTAWSNIQGRMLDLLAATQRFRRVIITCRTQFFPTTQGDIYERTGFVEVGKGYTCPSIYLSLFSPKQVKDYLSKRFPRTFWQWLSRNEHPKHLEASRLVNQMKSLRCRPMLLANIEDIMTGARGCKNEYDMYDVLVRVWLKREERKAFERKINLDAAVLHSACTSLALELQKTGKRRIPKDVFSNLCKSMPDLSSLEDIDIGGRSLMNRTSLGDYRFAHFSIQEFLVAKALFEQQQVERLRDVRITPFLFEMLLQAMRKSETPESQVPNKIVTLKSLPLMNLDLENAQLRNICFDECDLSGTKFGKSRLVNCMFKRTNLSGARFSDSTFKSVFFMGAHLEGAEFRDITTESGIALHITAQGYLMVRIPGGSYQMGSSESSDEQPRHTVKVPDFYLGLCPVTNDEYGRYLEANPAAPKPDFWNDERFNQPLQPVVGVSWDDAKKYCEWAGLRLPSEAEWEYACRAGTATRYYTGNNESDLGRVGWYDKNSGDRPHAVGEKEPNQFGLFDMHGNVWEWVEDDWHGSYDGAPIDGRAWIDEPRAGYRVSRGGSWYDGAGDCRSAFRYYWPPGTRNRLGFRPARSIP